MLAAVAGKLLLESGGNSSSSSNNASGDNEDHCAVKKEEPDQTVGEESNCDHPERRFFVSEILPKAHETESFNRSPSSLKDFHFGSTSGLTSEYSSEKFGNQELPYEATKIDNNGECYRSGTDHDKRKSMLGGLNCEPKLSRNDLTKDEHHTRNGFRKPIPQNPSVCSDDDDENFSARYATKSFRSTLRIGDRRIRKVLASKYCKVSPKPKDTTVTNPGML